MNRVRKTLAVAAGSTALVLGGSFGAFAATNSLSPTDGDGNPNNGIELPNHYMCKGAHHKLTMVGHDKCDGIKLHLPGLTNSKFDQVGKQGPQGEPGPQGPQGDKGEKGDRGPSGLLGAVTEKPSAAIQAVGPGETVTATATCGDGEMAIGGGYDVKDAKAATLANAVVTKNAGAGNYSNGMFDAWQVRVTNTGDAGSFNVYPEVVCATVPAQ